MRKLLVFIIPVAILFSSHACNPEKSGNTTTNNYNPSSSVKQPSSLKIVN